jgi:uncharacterized membrane protein
MTARTARAASSALILALSASLAGCQPPSPPSKPALSFPGVTFIGDKTHPIRIRQLSADGRAGVGLLWDESKGPTEIVLDGPPPNLHSIYWTATGGVRSIKGLYGDELNVEAISADGSTVAGWNGDKDLRSHVLLWTEQGGLSDLGFLDGLGPAPCFGCNPRPVAVSANGAVVFGSYAGGSFRWTRETGLKNLHIPGEIRIATPDGTIAAGANSVAHGAGFIQHLFQWSLRRGYEDLGAPSGADSLEATGVSADGSTIVGYYRVQSKDRRAFRWTKNLGFQTLSGAAPAAAIGVSGDGRRIIGEADVSTAGQRIEDRVVEWVDGGPMQIVTPHGLAVYRVSALSQDGHVIAGGAYAGPGDREAFLLRR